MNKTVCVLHVGTEKTGTTSIQRFLAMNAGPLGARGVFVPRSLVADAQHGPYNHVKLATASRLGGAAPDDMQQAFGLTDMAMVEDHRRSVAAHLAAERAGLARHPELMLISNEHVQSRLRRDGDLRHAKELLAAHCDAFRIVVYLRPQTEMATSVAFTAIRNGETELRLLPDFSAPNGFDPVLGVDFGYFDHAALLERLARVFGAEALDVRLYDRSEMYAGDIVQDFFRRLGMDIAGLPLPGRENAHLAPDAAMFLMRVNAAVPPGRMAPATREHILAYLSSVPSAGALLPARAEAERFAALFEAGNETVRRRYFPRRERLFDRDSKQYPEAAAAVGFTDGDMIRMFLACHSQALALRQ